MTATVGAVLLAVALLLPLPLRPLRVPVFELAGLPAQALPLAGLASSRGIGWR